jgi:GNAT superfamily N-acetyltransferase
MDDITIRKATPKDAEAACAVLVRSIKEICAPYYENDEEILAQWLENKTPASVRGWIESDRSYYIVAVNAQDQVLGFAGIAGAEIMLNYVIPEVLHRGIGKGMLQALETQAIACGFDHIRAVSSIPAKEFYERNGYVSDGAPRLVGRIVGDFPLIKTMLRNHAPDRRP